MFINVIACVLLSVLFFNTYICHRRIVNGGYITADKRYLVYLMPSNLSRNSYESWLCGGCIVTPTKILTAASCLSETDHIYAIAGLKIYVPLREIDHNECTKRWKQRVVQVSIPAIYKSTQSNKKEPVIFDNVGIAVVERPYNFSDLTYRLHCSYVPMSIPISFEPNEEAVGKFVFMMGWGSDKMRKVDDKNRPYVYTALSRICVKSTCLGISKYRNYTTELIKLIAKHIVCVKGTGFIDPIGKLTIVGNTTNQQCKRRRRRIGNTLSPECIELNEFEGNYDYDDYDFRKKMLSNIKNISKNIYLRNSTERVKSNLGETRRQGGICQNDHGGPLVTWVGNTETVIGVALTKFPQAEIKCNEPYFFFSTFSVAPLIICLLTDDFKYQQECATKAAQMGYTIQHKYVRWDNKPLFQEEREYETADVSLRPLKPLRP